MLTGNKGEWSEIYVFLKLLGEGKLYKGDAHGKIITDIFYPIINILKKELSGQNSYIVNSDIQTIKVISGNESFDIAMSTFQKQAQNLLTHIKNSGKTFECSFIEDFLKTLKITKIKEKSNKKSDITLTLHDTQIGTKIILGFSIKSYLGSKPTLFNASQQTNFIYEVTGISDSDAERINFTVKSSGKNNIKERIRSLLKEGKAIYCPQKDSIFYGNLCMIDSSLPEIFSYLILYYFSGESKPNLLDLTGHITNKNPLNFNTSHNHYFYEIKIKRLLVDIALGMVPGTVWNGYYDSTAGYIIVKDNGHILSYHIYNQNDFENYLLQNTCFDTPSSSRNKFGTIYNENGKWYIKLNATIRFI